MNSFLSMLQFLKKFPPFSLQKETMRTDVPQLKHTSRHDIVGGLLGVSRDDMYKYHNTSDTFSLHIFLWIVCSVN